MDKEFYEEQSSGKVKTTFGEFEPVKEPAWSIMGYMPGGPMVAGIVFLRDVIAKPDGLHAVWTGDESRQYRFKTEDEAKTICEFMDYGGFITDATYKVAGGES